MSDQVTHSGCASSRGRGGAACLLLLLALAGCSELVHGPSLTGDGLDGPLAVIASGEHFALDPLTGAATTLPELPSPRFAALAVVISGSLHVIGGLAPGFPPNAPIDDHDVFEPLRASWALAPRPPRPIQGAGALLLGEVYLHDWRSGVVHRFDPAAGTWRATALVVADEPIHAFGEVAGLVYAADGIGRVTGYDPAADRVVLTTRAPLNPGPDRALVTVGVAGGRVLVAELPLVDPPRVRVHAFDPALGTWRLEADLLVPMFVALSPLHDVGGRTAVVGASSTTTFALVRDALGSWRLGATAPEPLAGGQVGVTAVAGGEVVGLGLASVLRYDPALDRWTRVASDHPFVPDRLVALGGRLHGLVRRVP